MDGNESVTLREDFSDEIVEKYDVRGVAAFGEGYKFMSIVSFPSGPFYVDYCNEKTMDWKAIVIQK